MVFDPSSYFGEKMPGLKKPGFIPIIASNLLASIFMKKFKDRPGDIYGFVVEEWTAGGHNAPPRKGGVYGPKDEVDYGKIHDLGLPFWIGGSKASPEKLHWAKSVGATGIQAGSIFALCRESGMDTTIRKISLRLGFNKDLIVRTSLIASPAGFPFKVACLPGSLSEESAYLSRKRVCDQGGLRTLFERPDGSIGYRCAAEPVEEYIRKLGLLKETEGARCICNGLISTAGLGDVGEAPIITLGDDNRFLQYLLTHPEGSYGAVDAIKYLSR